MRPLDLAGRRSGGLVALRFLRSGLDGGGNPRRIWLVRCDCGVEREMPAGTFTSGRVFSCGCAVRDLIRAKKTKHGHAKGNGSSVDSTEYRSWRAMLARCLDSKNLNFKNYGGRGITVCDRWRKSFADFLADLGRKPTAKHTIDRIDVNGNYEPGNVRWATRLEQAKNTRRSRSRSEAS